MGRAWTRRCGARSARLLRATGALERSDPIPIGVYWIDSFEPGAFTNDPQLQAAIEAARDAYSDRLVRDYPGALEVVRTEHTDAVASYCPAGEECRRLPAHDWVLFRVHRPIPRWPPDARWGFPEIAERGLATQESETSSGTEPTTIWDELPDILPESTAGKAVVIGATVLAVGLVIYGVTRR